MVDETYAANRTADYYGAETLYAIWLTAPEVVTELLPPPLEPLDLPVAAAFVARYPEVSFETPYMAGALVLACRYGGEVGSYVLSMPEDDDLPVFMGREILGFPKKMGKLGLTRDGQTMEAFVERRGVRLFELRVDLNGQLNSPRALAVLGQLFELPREGDTTLPASDAVTFLFKYAHGAEPDKPFEHPPLLVRQVTTNRPEVVELGVASAVLRQSPYDSPWGRVKVVEMLCAAYTMSHNTMLAPTVLAEVDEQAFLPYSLLKYEW